MRCAQHWDNFHQV